MESVKDSAETTFLYCTDATNFFLPMLHLNFEIMFQIRVHQVGEGKRSIMMPAAPIHVGECKTVYSHLL